VSDEYREWDAAYLLGALSSADRRAYEEHLQTCDECSAGVASLADMPAVLAALPNDRALATIGWAR
jgi:anti-sigma factor RsiW